MYISNNNKNIVIANMNQSDASNQQFARNEVNGRDRVLIYVHILWDVEDLWC